ncbi:MAG: hypothetical protein ACI9BF_000654 [Candidatus Paceibacteria bacterium]|jgi:hypothetical protein
MNNTKTHTLLPQEKHGPLEKVFDNIWIVKGGSKLPMPVRALLTKTMTILRNPENNELTLINAMRVSEAMMIEMADLGEIKNVLTIGGGHGKDDGFYKEKFGAKVYDVEGHSYTRSLDGKSEIYMTSDVQLTAESPLPIPNTELKIIHTNSSPEGVLHLKVEGGVYITGDSLQNTPKADEFVNFFAKRFMKKGGFFKAYNVGPAWFDKTQPNVSDFKSVFLNTDYDNVIPGHGNPVIGGAKDKYRPAVEAAIEKLQS